MPGETTTWKALFASPTDEVKAFPAQVSQPGQETWDKLLKERLLKLTEHGSEYTAASGDWVKATANIKVNLPTPTANAVVAVSANNHEVKVAAGSALIYGDWITGATPVTLVGYQHLLLMADGSNWHILAGESKRTQEYGALTSRSLNTAYEVSSTRPAVVILQIAFSTTGQIAKVGVGGPTFPVVVEIQGVYEIVQSVTVWLNPGQEWQVTGNPFQVRSSQIVL